MECKKNIQRNKRKKRNENCKQSSKVNIKMYSSILSTNLGRYAKQQDVTTTVFFHILFTLKGTKIFKNQKFSSTLPSHVIKFTDF